MKVALKIFRSIVLCLFTAQACFCSSSSEQETDNKLSSSHIILKNFGAHYEYIVYLNNEPIHSAMDLSFLDWSGFPLKEGINEIRFKFMPIRELPHNKLEVRQEFILLNNNSLDFIKQIRVLLADGKQKDYSIPFAIQPILSGPNYALDGLNSISKSKIVYEIRKISINILKMFSSRDFTGLANLYYLKDDKNFYGHYPEWIYDKDNNDIEIRSINRQKDLEILVGEKLIMVKPNTSFLKRTNINGMLLFKDRKREVDFSIACLIFARIKHEWNVRGKDNIFYRVRFKSEENGVDRKN